MNGIHIEYMHISYSGGYPCMRVWSGMAIVCICLESRTSVARFGHLRWEDDARCYIFNCTSQASTIDFIGPLPIDKGCDYLITITDRLGSDLRFIPTITNITVEQLAILFFDCWYCENGLLKEIICHRDKIFVLKFWKHLMLLTGIKAKMSSAYHPQIDGSGECTNKTVAKFLRFHLERNQKGWKRALPRICFQIMNIINKSTKFSPFQLIFRKSHRVCPHYLSLGKTPQLNIHLQEQFVKELQ